MVFVYEEEKSGVSTLPHHHRLSSVAPTIQPSATKLFASLLLSSVQKKITLAPPVTILRKTPKNVSIHLFPRSAVIRCRDFTISDTVIVLFTYLHLVSCYSVY